MENILKKISIEHEDLFPLATLGSQIEKLEEELEEVEKTNGYYNTINEIADCFIVCCGIYRFAPKVALLNASSLIATAEQFGIRSVLLKSVEAKWEFNKSRKWEFKDGMYHHVGEDKYDRD